MADYSIFFARSARKELQVLESKTSERIFQKIQTLREEPRPHGCKKLIGYRNLWRIRIGDFRVIYSIDDKNNIVDISAIKHRSEAY